MSLLFETCPTCGTKTIQRVSDDYAQEDGVIIPRLHRWQCSSCKANFFDDAAMRRIEDARQMTRPLRNAKRSKVLRVATD